MDIEPDEITAALEAHPKVQAAATVAAHDRSAARLACFAIPRAGAAPAANELRAWLHARLPVALVPSSLTLVDRWPLSPSGKLDEAALLALEAMKIATPSAPPTQSAFDGQVRDLFQELLHTPEVGGNDDFFQLGGDSLRAAELLLRIERRFGRTFSLGQLLAHSNVGALARLLASESRHEAPSTAVPLETGGSRHCQTSRQQPRRGQRQGGQPGRGGDARPVQPATFVRPAVAFCHGQNRFPRRERRRAEGGRGCQSNITGNSL
ncbi:MAG TPA: phosphopantetheine-binding protein [Pirellulales bacterium]|nr:phosphopantetheine-binding protein [Pirellulales bacterium]